MCETGGKNIKQTRFILNIFLVEKYNIYPMLKKIPGRKKEKNRIYTSNANPSISWER